MDRKEASDRGSKKSRKSKKSETRTTPKRVSTRKDAARAWFTLSASKQEEHYNVVRIESFGGFLFGKPLHSMSKLIAEDVNIVDRNGDVSYSKPGDMKVLDMIQSVLEAVKNDLKNEFTLEHMMSLSEEADQHSATRPPDSGWFSMHMSMLEQSYPEFHPRVRFLALMAIATHIANHVKALMFDSKDLCEEFQQARVKSEEATRRMKTEGNDSFNAGAYQKAISLYTGALRQNPYSYILYSNRCICYLKQAKPLLALVDGRRCAVLQPDWERGQQRYVQSLIELDLYDVAKEASEKAQLLCKSNSELSKQYEVILQTFSKRGAAAGKPSVSTKTKMQTKSWVSSQFDDMPDLVTDEEDADSYDDGYDDEEDEDGFCDFSDASSPSDCYSSESFENNTASPPRKSGPGKSQPSTGDAAKPFQGSARKSTSDKRTVPSTVSKGKSKHGQNDDDNIDEEDELPGLVSAASDEADDGTPELRSESDSADEAPAKKAPKAKQRKARQQGAGSSSEAGVSASPAASKASNSGSNADPADLPGLVTDSSSCNTDSDRDSLSSESDQASVPADKPRPTKSKPAVSESSIASTIRQPQQSAPTPAKHATKGPRSGHAEDASTKANNVKELTEARPSNSQLPAAGVRESTDKKGTQASASPVTATLQHGMERFALLDLLRLGSQEVLVTNYACGIAYYLEALKATDVDKKLMGDWEKLVLLYCTASGYLQIGDLSSLQRAAEHLDVILNNYSNISFPLVHYGHALLNSKLHNFQEAVDDTEKGLAMLRKSSGQIVPCKWPGTDTDIPQSQGVKLNELFVDLRAICLNPPRPDGLCRYAECKTRKQIYLNDPDFKGLVRTNCTALCHVEYHPNCWRRVRSDNPDKPSERDLLGGCCLTPDCDGRITSIIVQDADGETKKHVRDDSAVSSSKPPTAAPPTVGKLRQKTKGKQRQRQADDDVGATAAYSYGRLEAFSTKNKDKFQKPPAVDEDVCMPAGDDHLSATSSAAASSKVVAQADDAKGASPPGLDKSSIATHYDESNMVMLKRSEDDECLNVSAAKPTKGKAKKKKAKAAAQGLDEFLGDQYVARGTDGTPLVRDSDDLLLSESTRYASSMATPVPVSHATPAPYTAHASYATHNRQSPIFDLDISSHTPGMTGSDVPITMIGGPFPDMSSHTSYPHLRDGAADVSAPPTVSATPACVETDEQTPLHSMFAQVVRYGGQMTLDDPRFQELISMLPPDALAVIDEAGGLQAFLHLSSTFAFRDGKVFLREFMATVDDSTTRGSTSKAIDINQHSSGEKPTDSATDDASCSPALNADAHEFVPKSLPIAGRQGSSDVLVTDGFTTDVVPALSQPMPPMPLYGMSPSMLPGMPPSLVPPVSAMPYGVPGPGIPFLPSYSMPHPPGQPPGPPPAVPPGMMNTSPPMSHQQAILAPSSTVDGRQHGVPPAYPDSKMYDMQNPDLAEQMAEVVLFNSSTSSKVSSEAPVASNVTSEADVGDKLSPSSPPFTVKTKKQKKKALAATAADSESTIVLETGEKGSQTDPDFDAAAQCDSLREECAILQQQLSDVNDRQHRQKRQFEMDLGTAQKKTSEAEERVTKYKNDFMVLREKHEAEVKNVAEAKRVRQQLRDLEARETKLKSDLELSRKEVDRLRQQVDADREEFSKQLSLSESRERDLQSTVGLFKRRAIAAEIMVVELRLEIRLQAVEGCVQQARAVAQRIQYAIGTGQNVAAMAEQQHLRIYLTDLQKCSETLRSMKSEQVRLLESSQKELADLPLIGVTLPTRPRSLQPQPVQPPPAQQYPAGVHGPGGASTNLAAASGVPGRPPLLGTPPVPRAGLAAASGSNPEEPAVSKAPTHKAPPTSSTAASRSQQYGPLSDTRPSHQASQPSAPPHAHAMSSSAAAPGSSSVPTSNPTSSGSSSGSGRPTGDKKPNSFEKIICQLAHLYPNRSRQSLVEYIRQVRAENNNSLSGISLEEVVRRVSTIVENQQRPNVPPPGTAAGDASGAGPQRPGKRSAAPAPRPTVYTMDESEDCVICCEEMTSHSTTTLNCRHTFHTECIRKWFNEQNTCPTCRVHSLMPDEYPALS